MLRDMKPDEESEYIDLNPNLEKPAPPATATAETPAAAQAPAVTDMEVDDGAEASLPAPFEYPFGSNGA
jgi:hypothetical protein